MFYFINSLSHFQNKNGHENNSEKENNKNVKKSKLALN